jgi:BirA family biotin operon repressor/biotin-[acetyl-CoA-carboxylase] ligase
MLKAAGFPVQLKWPNDLVVAGKKLGGILLESKLKGDRLSQCMVGVGLNWINPVPATGVSLHSLLTQDTAHPCRQLSDVAALVLLGIEAGVLYWQTHGNAAVAQQYYQLLAYPNQWIQIPATVSAASESQVVSEPQDTSAPRRHATLTGDRPSDRIDSPLAGQSGQLIGVAPNGHLLVQVVHPQTNAPTVLTFAPGTITTGYGQP